MEWQLVLALKVLCGFDISEIALTDCFFEGTMARLLFGFGEFLK
jgi:hypothetical protein